MTLDLSAAALLSDFRTNTSAEPPSNRRRKLAIQLALLATILLLLAWRAQPDQLLHVTFLETKGDAALIQTPAAAMC